MQLSDDKLLKLDVEKKRQIILISIAYFFERKEWKELDEICDSLLTGV